MANKFPQEALDALAKSIADEVHGATKVLVGYAAKEAEAKRRVEFTFRFGVDKYSFPTVDIVELEGAHEWQTIFERCVRKVLFDTSKWAYAKRLYEQARAKAWQPEVPVFIDQQGRRHHTMKAETGYLEGLLGNVKLSRGSNEQAHNS